MKKRNFLLSAAALAVTLTGMAFLSDAVGNEKAEQRSLEAQPSVCFNIRLPYTLNQKISQKIQADNKMLITLLEQLRSMPLDNEDSIIKAARMMQDKLKGTYLQRARLVKDDAKMPYEGWKAIVMALKDVLKKDTEFYIPLIEVQGYYVPFAGAPNPQMDVDLKMLVRTTVIMGPHNDLFEGELCHRRTCDPIPCDADGGER